MLHNIKISKSYVELYKIIDVFHTKQTPDIYFFVYNLIARHIYYEHLKLLVINVSFEIMTRVLFWTHPNISLLLDPIKYINS